MIEVKLSPRLEGVLSSIPFGSVIADIGADHGRLSAAACQRGSTPRAVAIDTSRRAVRLIERTAARSGVGAALEARHGYGLDPLGPREVESVVIAGMGADRIVSILSPSVLRLETVKTLVLAPNGSARPIRTWLRSSGWRLEDEIMVFEGQRPYCVLRANRTTRAGSELPYREAAAALFGRAFAQGEPAYIGMAVSAEAALDELGPLAIKHSDSGFRAFWFDQSIRLRQALKRRGRIDEPRAPWPSGLLAKAQEYEAALALTTFKTR